MNEGELRTGSITMRQPQDLLDIMEYQDVPTPKTPATKKKQKATVGDIETKWTELVEADT